MEYVNVLPDGIRKHVRAHIARIENEIRQMRRAVEVKDRQVENARAKYNTERKAACDSANKAFELGEKVRTLEKELDVQKDRYDDLARNKAEAVARANAQVVEAVKNQGHAEWQVMMRQSDTAQDLIEGLEAEVEMRIEAHLKAVEQHRQSELELMKTKAENDRLKKVNADLMAKYGWLDFLLTPEQEDAAEAKAKAEAELLAKYEAEELAKAEAETDPFWLD